MAKTDELGLATKNFDSGTEVPASVPPVQAGPVASVVYGFAPATPNDCAGAPGSPQKTWFQTPLLHPSMSLFLVTHCCWEPLVIDLPVNSESAMNPPLAKSGEPLQ